LVEHFHGKEGVIGSSPIEGSSESPAAAGLSRSRCWSHREGSAPEDNLEDNRKALTALA
jgi:hypothetical protein